MSAKPSPDLAGAPPSPASDRTIRTVATPRPRESPAGVEARPDSAHGRAHRLALGGDREGEPEDADHKAGHDREDRRERHRADDREEQVAADRHGAAAELLGEQRGGEVAARAGLDRGARVRHGEEAHQHVRSRQCRAAARAQRDAIASGYCWPEAPRSASPSGYWPTARSNSVNALKLVLASTRPASSAACYRRLRGGQQAVRDAAAGGLEAAWPARDLEARPAAAS